MRLTCPNCDAQYEIEASLIPPTGRDVQCSNCGKTWFQPPEGGLAEDPLVVEAPEPDPEPEVAEVAAPADPEPMPVPETADANAGGDVDLSGLTDEAAAFFGTTSPAQAAPEPEEDISEPDDPAEVPDETFDDVPEEEPAPAADLPRREIDPEVREILREEAEREIAARKADRGEVIETQAEMGLNQPAVPAATAATARLRGDPVEETGRADDTLRKSMLPDVEEINSTLIATSDRPDRLTTQQDIEETVQRRSGFRIGFATMLGLATLLIVLYLSAPALGRMIPALSPALAGYVDWANGMRLAIDGLLASVLGGG
ncbi:MAG: zinc-ribbon domain-containing protein [Pseudomonadota bacterium]